MNERISNIFDYGDEIVVDKERDDRIDPARIKELTMKRILNEDFREEAKRTVKKARPVYRTVLIAAVIAVVLIGTALAVCQIAMKDTLTGESEIREIDVWEDGASSEPTHYVVECLEKTMNGLPDSPEYKAYVEWREWRDAWHEENPTPWKDRGLDDDTYHETPDNYAYYYGAGYAEEGEKLDEITEKYGLTLHTVRAQLKTEEELCAVLGVSDIISGAFRGVDGTAYEDGSFLFYGLMQEEPEIEADICLAAKGSLSLFSDWIPADYEEWSYTTADGTPVALAMADVSDYPSIWVKQANAWLVAQFDDALFSVSFTGVADRAELEALADRLNLADLAALFSAEGDRSGIPAAAAAQQEAFETEQAAQKAEQQRRIEEQEAYRNQYTSEEWGDVLREELGDYTLPETLEGQHNLGFGLRVDPSAYAITITYSDDSYEGEMRYYATYAFRYERAWSDETHSQSTTREDFEAHVRLLTEEGVEFEVMEIGGYEVYVDGPTATWYDAERDLRFSIYDCHGAFDPEPFTQEQIVGLAESFISSLADD